MEPIGSLIVDQIRGNYPSKRYACDYTVYSGMTGRAGDETTFQAQFSNGDLIVIGPPFKFIECFANIGINDTIKSLDEKIAKLHKTDEILDLGFLREHHNLLPKERTTG